MTPGLDPSGTPRPRTRQPTTTPTPPVNTSIGHPNQAPLLRTPATIPVQTEAMSISEIILMKILDRLEALERHSMPPPLRQPVTRARPSVAVAAPQGETNVPITLEPQTQTPQLSEEESGEFTVVSRNGRGRRGGGKQVPPQINLTPASYASAAASAANAKQPNAPANPSA